MPETKVKGSRLRDELFGNKEVKQQNPYLGARPCPFGEVPLERIGNNAPRQIIIRDIFDVVTEFGLSARQTSTHENALAYVRAFSFAGIMKIIILDLYIVWTMHQHQRL